MLAEPHRIEPNLTSHHVRVLMIPSTLCVTMTPRHASCYTFQASFSVTKSQRLKTETDHLYP